VLLLVLLPAAPLLPPSTSMLSVLPLLLLSLLVSAMLSSKLCTHW
jgi:hypothetical protein